MPLRIVTAQEMQALDRQATSKLSVPSIVLMENAARSICDVVENYFAAEFPELKVLVVCGKGNNGGDGLACARLLANRGALVSVVLLGRASDLKADPKLNLAMLKHCDVALYEVQDTRRLNRLQPEFAAADLIIDAVFGTGFKGKPAALSARAIEAINTAEEFVLAVDIPSGVQADDGKVLGAAVVADATVTMALMKRGLLLHPGRDLCGDLWIGDIGAPHPTSRTSIHRLHRFHRLTEENPCPSVFTRGSKEEGDTFLLEEDDAAQGLPLRPASGHKGTFGTAVIAAGSPGFTGAATLSSLAALRSGCGLCRLIVPEGILPVLESKVTEAVKHGAAQTEEGALSVEALPLVLQLLETADAFALGPGIGTSPETRDLELKLIREARLPLLIDADGITNLAGSVPLLKNRRYPTVLTPHPGELSRLLGLSPREINEGRIDIARRTARDWNVVLVLKGAPTVIASPDGVVYLNPTGNSGLGSGGTGDVLTGLITGLLAQGASALDAASTAVYLHGLAGDLAARHKTEYALIAGDLLDYLPQALRAVTKWPCGQGVKGIRSATRSPGHLNTVV